MFALFLMADFFVAMDTANISLTFSPRTYFKITEGNSQTGPPSLRWIIIRSLAIMVFTRNSRMMKWNICVKCKEKWYSLHHYAFFLLWTLYHSLTYTCMLTNHMESLEKHLLYLS